MNAFIPFVLQNSLKLFFLKGDTFFKGNLMNKVQNVKEMKEELSDLRTKAPSPPTTIYRCGEEHPGCLRAQGGKSWSNSLASFYKLDS